MPKVDLTSEEVILDFNELARGKKFFCLGAAKVSPNGKLLAFSVDEIGDEKYRLYVKNLATETLLEPICIPNTLERVEWANDNNTLFYIVLDDRNRPYKLIRQAIRGLDYGSGSERVEPQVLLLEKDDRFGLHLEKSRNGRFLIVTATSETTSECHVLDADDPWGKLQLLCRRNEKEFVLAEHHETGFLVLSHNSEEEAINGKLYAVSIGQERSSWKELISYRPHVRILSLVPFRHYLALCIREHGVTSIELWTMPITQGHALPLFKLHACEPLASSLLSTSSSQSPYEGNTLRVSFHSFDEPSTVWDFDMSCGLWRLIQRPFYVLDGPRYCTNRFMVPTTDTHVPLSIVYREDFVCNGTASLLLGGYGAYEASFDPCFDIPRLCLLDRGFAYAIAHVRGGGELGKTWHEAGKQLNKKNSMNDFIACAEYLIKHRFTCPSKLFIEGRSAGGLLMCAVANMRPELFRGVIARVPFVDLVTTMADDNIPLTTTERDEWGDPNDEKSFYYMLSYSPYDTIPKGVGLLHFPAMFVSAALNDSRVCFWEPVKFVAKLRASIRAFQDECNITDHTSLARSEITVTKNGMKKPHYMIDSSSRSWRNPLILLKTDMNAGHAGHQQMKNQQLKEAALEYSFLLDLLCQEETN